MAILVVSSGAPWASAQTLTSLVSFSGTNGSQPAAPLVQGFDGNLYGVTYGGGNVEAQCSTSLSSAGCGMVFKVTPAGVGTVRRSGPRGQAPRRRGRVDPPACQRGDRQDAQTPVRIVIDTNVFVRILD